MRKSVFLQEVEEQLWKLGCPRERMRELIRELAEHREDLRLAELSRGVSEAQAEANAEARLGDSRKVAADLMAACRQAHWWARCPILSFGLLPFLVSVLGFVLLVICSGYLVKTFGQSFLPAGWADGGAVLDWMGRWVLGLYAVAICGTAIVFSKLARNSGCGWKWVFIVCAVCAAEGCIGRPILRPHCFQFQFVFHPNSSPNWFCGLLPLIFAAMSYRRGSRVTAERTMGFGGVILAAALGFSTMGCASQPKAKPEYQRSWIGGDYKAMPRPRPHGQTNTSVSGQSKMQKKGLLILALGTNSPARTAGLREGDLILEVNSNKVTTLKALYREIDKVMPGKPLSVIVSREGALQEFTIPTGRETYQKTHYVALGLFARQLRFGGDSTISLIVVGYHGSSAARLDLESVENRYLARVNPKTEFDNPGWSAWAGIIDIGGYQKVLKQEPAGFTGNDSTLSKAEQK